MSFVSLVTIRAKNSNEERNVLNFIEQRILPLMKQRNKDLNIRLAKCVNCLGEFTLVSEWDTREDLDSLNKDTEFQALVQELEEKFLRLPPKKEIWEIVYQPSESPSP